MDPKYVEAIHDDYEGFRILLRGESPESPMLRLVFDPPPLSYRVIEEASWLSPDMADHLFRAPGSRFVVVADSDFLRWFQRISSGIREWPNIRHYVVCMANQIVEIIACRAPGADNLSDSGTTDA